MKPELTLEQLMDKYERGYAIGEGDCFFDSVAQALKILRPSLDFNIKSLRNACKKFAEIHLKRNESWLKRALENENENIIKYISCIEFSSDDFKNESDIKNKFQINNPIWGRSEIEGRIISTEYNVKLYIFQEQTVESETLIALQIIDKMGSKLVYTLPEDCDVNVILFSKETLNFAPLFRRKDEIIQKVSMINPQSFVKTEYVRPIRNSETERLKDIPALSTKEKLNIKTQVVSKLCTKEHHNKSATYETTKLIPYNKSNHNLPNEPNFAQNNFLNNHCSNQQKELPSLIIKKLSHLAIDVIKMNIERSLINPKYDDTALIILSCEYNIIEILNFVTKNRIKGNSVKSINQEVFYYAIRSNNIEILNLLVNFYTNNYEDNIQELYKMISNAYEEIKLKNISLIDKMEMQVLGTLLNFKFLNHKFENSNAQCVELDLQMEVRKRIQLTIELSKLAISEYILDNRSVDNKLRFLCTSIARNLHILKKQLKITYEKLPWEEMEFCLIAFVSSHIKQEEINWIYNLVLNKQKLLNYLEEFIVTLENLQIKDEDIGSSFKNTKRAQIIENVIKYNKKFKPLFVDYIQIKNVYSLYRIKYYVDIALSEKIDDVFDYLVMKRALLVTGEYLKDTLESPHLSIEISEKIFALFQINVRKIIIKLRDQLSHFHIYDEKNILSYETEIRNDLIKVKRTIDNVFYDIQAEKIQEILKKISECKNIEEATKLNNLFNNFELKELNSKSLYISEIDRVKELFEELKEEIKYPTEYNKELIEQIENKIQKEMKQSIEIKLAFSENIVEVIYIVIAIQNKKPIQYIRSYANYVLNLFQSKTCKNDELGEILHLIYNLYKTVEARTKNNSLVFLVLQVFFNTSLKPKQMESLIKFTNEFEKTVEAEYLKDGIFESVTTIDKILDEENCKMIDIIYVFEELENFINRLRAKQFDSDKYNILLKSFHIKSEHQTKFKECVEQARWKELASGWQYYVDNYRKFKNSVKKFLKDKEFQEVAQKIKTLFESMNKNVSDSFTSKLEDALNEISKLEDQKLENCLNESITNIERALKIGTIEKFHNNLRKLTVVRETLLLDAFTYLEEKKKRLNSNHHGSQNLSEKFILLFIDKPLRNYLAHGNPLIDILEANAYLAVIDNCKRVVNNNIELMNSNAYFVTNEPLSKIDYLKLQYQNTLKILSKQYEMFLALKETKFDILTFKRNVAQRTYDTYARDINNRNILHYAAKYDSISFFTLFWNDRLINENDKSGSKPLHIATQEGSLNILKFCLQNNIIQVGDYFNSKGFSLLDYAKKYRQIEAFELLFKHCNNNETLHKFITKYSFEKEYKCFHGFNYKRFATLHTAVYMRRKDMVVFFYELGTNINEKDDAGSTPLHLAAKHNYIEIVEYLLTVVDVNLNLKDNQGLTPLHLAIENCHKQTAACILKATNLGINNVSEVKKHVQIKDNVIICNINCTNSYGWTPLHTAAKIGEKDLVELLLEHRKINLNCEDKDKYTPLHVASFFGHKNVVELFLRLKDVEINCRALRKITPLHLVAQNGHKDVVELFLNQEYVDVNCKENNGFTPLHMAAQGGHKDVVELFFKHNKVSVNSENNQKYTPLHLAAQSGHKDVVELFLNHKDVNHICRNINKVTPLHLAAKNGHKDIVDMLINQKLVDPICNDIDDYTPLHLAAKGGHKDVIELLLKNTRININCKTKKGLTPLYLATHQGHKDVVQMLLKQKNIDVNCKQNIGITPLYAAAHHGYKDLVEIFLKHKSVDVNCRDKENLTALHLAAHQGHKFVVEILLKQKCIDVNCKDNENYTPLHLAAQNGHKDIIQIILKQKDVDVNCKNNEEATPLHSAALRGNKDVVELFLNNKNIDVNCKTKEGFTPLRMAVEKCHDDIIEILLKQENVDVNCKDEEDYTPLHLAAQNGHKDIIKIILKQKDVDVNCKDNEEATPLHLAILRGDKDVVELLLNKKNIDVNCKTKEGLTPLHMAVDEGHDDIIEILLKQENVDVNCKDEEDYTPLHFAAQECRKNAVKMLLQHNEIDINCKTNQKLTPLILAEFDGHKEIVEMLLKHKN